MPSSPEIWLPTSQMKATVKDGEVTIWEEMTMEKKKIKQEVGFAEKKLPKEVSDVHN